MATTKITRNFQVSIPKAIRERLRLEEGDLLEVEERDGRIVMAPQRLVDADQAWFWSREWQEGERQAEEDVRAGRLSGPFKSVEEIKKHFGDA